MVSKRKKKKMGRQEMEKRVKSFKLFIPEYLRFSLFEIL